MTQRWSAKLEYDYLGFGTETLNFGIPLGAATTFKTQINEVKVGLNYRWATVRNAAPVRRVIGKKGERP